MSNFEEMQALFEKMGLEIRVTPISCGQIIDVTDNAGNDSAFFFNLEGSLNKTGYNTEVEVTN